MNQEPSALRIFYFCPDFPQPSGGTKKIYRHVRRLRQAGFEATVVHQRHGFVLDWHLYPAPVIWLEDRPRFESSDILVFPEVMADLVRQTKDFAGRRVVLALSWAPSYTRLRPGERWQDYNIAQVLTTSPVIRDHVAWSMEIDVALVHDYVDPAHYCFRPEEKQAQLAFLTRKDATGEWLRGVLARRWPDLQEIAWLALRNMDEETYASHLRKSRFFLATTLQEGMHISILEAMACGCVVVGYSGIGGHSHMVGEGSEQNCVMVENGNLLRLGQKLEETLAMWRRDPDTFLTLIENARATAQAYQVSEAETQSLVKFYAGQAAV